MNDALGRLQDLLERATPGPLSTGSLNGMCVFTDATKSVAVASVYTSPEDARLIALAPVLVSDMIALAEAAEYARECLEGFSTLRPVSMTEPYPASDYDEWRILRKDAYHVALPDLEAALSTVLAHIDDSLPIEGEGEGRSRARERSVERTSATDLSLEGGS